MTKQEILELGEKIRDGGATKEDKTKFLQAIHEEFHKMMAILNKAKGNK